MEEFDLVGWRILIVMDIGIDDFALKFSLCIEDEFRFSDLRNGSCGMGVGCFGCYNRKWIIFYGSKLLWQLL